MFKRFGLGFGVGYVLGARAGQKRYEELTAVAQRVMDLPLVQQASEQARNRVTQDRARHLLDQVRSRAGHARADDAERAGGGTGTDGTADEAWDEPDDYDGPDDFDEADDLDEVNEGYGSEEGYEEGGSRGGGDRTGGGRAGPEPRGAGDRVKAAASAALSRGRVD